MKEEDISRLIRNIRISISNMQLYPKESALVKDTIKLTFDSLNELLKESGSLVLSEADQNLLVNGKKIEFKGSDKASANSIVGNFLQNNIKSLTISAEITVEELAIFLEGLGRKKRGKEDTISKFVKDNKITHITINEKVYIALGEQDKITRGEDATLTGPDTQQKVYVEDKAEVSDGVVQPGERTGKESRVRHGTPVKSKAESVLDDTQNLLEKDDVSLLETDPNKLKGTLKELDNIDRVDLAGNVVDKLASNLESTEEDIRLKTVQSFKDTLPAVGALSDKKIFDELQGKFVVTEDKETNEQIYSELSELLEYGVDRFLKESNYTRTIEIIGMFRRHHSTKGEGFVKRWKIAEGVLSKLANPYVVGILISDLKSDDANRKNQAYTIIMKLQTAAVPVLIEAIKETEDIHMRKVIAFAIKNTEEKGMEKLVDEIGYNTSPEVAKRIIDVLNGIGGSEVVINKLKNAFKHYSPIVRKEIMRTLCKINTPDSLEILIEAIRDTDQSIKKEAISMLGRIKAKDAVDILIPLIGQRSIFSKDIVSDGLIEETCLTLGKIGDKKAVPSLVAIARGSSFLTFKKRFSKSIQLASISALAYFYTPEVKEVLHNLKDSKDPAISKAADNSLKIQEKALLEKEESLSQKIL